MIRPFLCFLLLSLLAVCNNGKAQDTIRKTVYFNSSSTSPLPVELYDVYQTLKGMPHYYNQTVMLEGHTDNSGRPEKNQQLSEQRAGAVSQLLQEHFKMIQIAAVTGKGHTRPVADNTTEAGKSRNRRVDILIIFTENGLLLPQAGSISELYQQMALTPQEFCINRYQDETIRCRGGTVLHIKAGSFASSVAGCITIRVKEVFTLSDMLLENLTTSSNERPLESQGMIYTEATDARGNRLQLQPGKDIVMMVPAGTIRPDAGIFYGERDSLGLVDWQTDSAARLSNFKLAGLNLCGRRFCAGVIMPPDCKPCAFFFCRVGRLHKAVGAVFSRKQRIKNRQFNYCQDLLQQWNDSTSQLNQRIRNRQQNNAPADTSNIPLCNQLRELLEQYGVTDYRGLMEALNKPLMERFKVTSIEALEDTLRKVKLNTIELAYQNKTLSLDDYQYYIFNNDRMGWINVDCFSEMKKRQLTDMDVIVTNNGINNCRLVFKERNTILSTREYSNNRYSFNGIPRGETVWIVAMGSNKGTPLLGMKEVTIKNTSHEVPMEALDLATFKERLKLLNR